MPNYKTHCYFNISTGIPIIAGMYPDRWNPVFVAGYLVATFIVTPDIDMNNSTPDRSLGWIWNKFWDPYNKIFKHRGLSHIAFIGTMSRFIYLTWIPFYIYIKYALGGDLDAFVGIWAENIINFYGGMATADNFHIILDIA